MKAEEITNGVIGKEVLHSWSIIPSTVVLN